MLASMLMCILLQDVQRPTILQLKNNISVNDILSHDNEIEMFLKTNHKKGTPIKGVTFNEGGAIGIDGNIAPELITLDQLFPFLLSSLDDKTLKSSDLPRILVERGFLIEDIPTLRDWPTADQFFRAIHKDSVHLVKEKFFGTNGRKLEIAGMLDDEDKYNMILFYNRVHKSIVIQSIVDLMNQLSLHSQRVVLSYLYEGNKRFGGGREAIDVKPYELENFKKYGFLEE